MTDENGKKDDAADNSTVSFLEGLYGDPLRTETMRTGRYLIIASAICMVVVLYKVRLQSTGLIPFDFGDRIDVLPMLVSLAVLLLLVSFVLRATTDLLLDGEKQIMVIRYVEGERTKAALAAAQATEADIANSQREDYDGGSDPWWESYGEIKEAADNAVAKAERKIGLRRIPRELRRTRKILEVSVPIAFGVLAIFLSRAAVAGFAGAVLSALLF